MPAHSDIDVRMKENYENPYRIKLTKRIPVIVRIDGKAFHTFTRGFDKPFDNILIKAMQATTKFLCENVMGCKLGYTQSDEISLLLIDYDTFSTQPYFDYNVQKIASVCASMATLEFNRVFKELVDNDLNDRITKEAYKESLRKGAMFDARCFNIPREEVTNYFYSRQIDATRNSIEMYGRAYFRDKELHGKSTSKIQDMLHETYNINWNDAPTEQKRGSCCYKTIHSIIDEKSGEEVIRSEWKIDHDIPIFKGTDRDYIEDYVNIDQ